MSKKTAKPIGVIPFELKNMNDFMPDKEYPNLHPDSKAYDNYWTKKTEDCLYGIWGDDSRIEGQKKVGGSRWMPGNLAFYTHHTIIKKEIEGQAAKGDAPPDCRDVDWLMGYDNSACDGFGGFEYDKEFTCYRPVGKLEAGIPLTNSEKKWIDNFSDHVRDKYGNFKKYKDAREYMYETRPEPLGKPLWLNEVQNYMLLSTRRLGKSYWIINGVIVYKFTFNGARTLDEYYNQKTSITAVVGSGNSDKTKEFFAKFNNAYDHLRTKVGSYSDGRTDRSGAWWAKTEGSVAKENSFITNTVKAEGRGAGQVGAGSRVWHVSYANSASKGAGTSLDEAVIEEVGLTPDVEDIHAENTPAQKSDRKFGKSNYIGTGGDFETIEGSKKLFYHPATFELLSCKNLFVKGGKDTARFIPATYYQDFRDENGNQNIQLAFEDIMTERDAKEKLDTLQYLRHKASYPLTPDEIFVKYDGNSFPIKNLETRKAFLKHGGLPYSVGKIAFMDSKNTEGYWIEDFDARPLMEMEDISEDNMNKEGAIVQYESPSPDRPKRKYNDRNPMYLTFMEPVRNDKGSSFVYAYVWKFWDYANPDMIQNNIVMEWFGRMDNDNDKNFEKVFAMAALYDSNIYAEMNNDRIKGYARTVVKKFNWLMPWLGNLDGLEASGTKEQEVGIYIMPGQNASLEKLTNEWLRKVVSFNEKIQGNEFKREEVIMADTLNSQMLCSQLIDYNNEGNFDAYDGIRLKAIWDKANEKTEDQYVDDKKEKELLTLMRKINASKNNNLRRKRAYGY